MIQDLLLRFIADYGYTGLFLALVLGIAGLPLPDELLMMFAGFLVAKGELLVKKGQAKAIPNPITERHPDHTSGKRNQYCSAKAAWPQNSFDP